MNLTFHQVLTQRRQLLALTAADSSSCSSSLPKGCAHPSVLLPEAAIQPSCSSCSYAALCELGFVSMQFMSFSLALGFSLWNFLSSSRYISPKFDLICDQYWPPFFVAFARYKAVLGLHSITVRCCWFIPKTVLNLQFSRVM